MHLCSSYAYPFIATSASSPASIPGPYVGPSTASLIISTATAPFYSLMLLLGPHI